MSAQLLSCSAVTKNDDGTVTTTYGFNAVDAISEFGAPDSLRVVVLLGNDTLSNTRYVAADLEGSKLFFDITADENAQVRVLYNIYTGGQAVAAGDQVFVSGESPQVPRPSLKPIANAGADTLLGRGSEWALAGTVERRADLAKGFAWDYDGDGRFEDSSAQNGGFYHTYADTGLYRARFRVVGPYGLFDDDTILVRVRNPLPVIQSLSVPSIVTKGKSADLAVKAASAYGSLVNYEWDLGGDGIWDTAGASLANVAIVVSQVGDWKVRVRVTDNEGRSVLDSTSLSVIADAANFPPQIDLLYQTDSVVSIHDGVGWRVDFNDGNTRNDVKKFEWDLDGDGIYEVVGTAPDSVSHVYNAIGVFTISVRITDQGGESAVASKSVRVLQGEPSVKLAVDKASVGITESVLFTAQASDRNDNAPDGRMVKYEWDFDGDGVYDRTSEEAEITHAYPDAYETHTYTAKVRITDDDGNTAISTAEVTVANRPPVLTKVSASATTVSIQKPSVLQIGADDFSDPDGNGLSTITWSFSDGAASRTLGRNDTLWLVRSQAGTVTVTATVVDQYGQTASQSVDVVVSTGSATIAGLENLVSVAGAQVHLNPTVLFSLGQSLASCRWNVGGSGFGAAAATCATNITLPNEPRSKFQVTVEAISDVGTTATRTIEIRVREALVDARDGEVYPVETYNYDGADHMWMAANLNYSGHTGSNLGVAGKTYTTGWCYGVEPNSALPHRDSSTCAEGYGRLYRWSDAMAIAETYNSTCYAANCAAPATPHQGLCPVGWHVPTQAEWNALVAFAENNDGIGNNAGAWLKSMDASDTQVGLFFGVLPTGYRDNTGAWNERNVGAYFWSATEKVADEAYSRYMDYGPAQEYANEIYKEYGYPVRCLKD